MLGTNMLGIFVHTGTKLCWGANMTGALSAAQAFSSNKYPLTKVYHCIAHSLNLALTDSRKVPDIKHCVMLIRDTHFFHFGAKPSAVFKTYAKFNLKRCAQNLMGQKT